MKHIKLIPLLLFFFLANSCDESISPPDQLLTSTKSQMAINDLLKLNAETNRGQSNDTQTNSFFGLGENEVEQILEPNLELSINALMDFGWTTEEIVEDFGSQNSPEIFSMATAAVTFYEDFDVYELNGEYIFTPKPHALNGDNDNYNKLRVCFLEATGIGLAMGALGIGSGELLSGLA